MKRATRFCCCLSVFISLLSYEGFSQVTIVDWNFPNNPDDAIVDASTLANTGITIYSTGGTGALAFNTAGATTRSASCSGWVTASGGKAWEIQINTVGYYNLELSSKQRSSATGPRDFKLQYKIGVAGAWVDLVAAINVQNNFTSGVVANLALPAACENQPSLFFQWVTTSNFNISGGAVAAGGVSNMDDLIIVSHDAINHYRSIATGNWNALSTWEASPDLITWSPATFVPSRYAKTITVRSPHTVSINSNVSFDETTINPGGGINYNSGFLTINDGSGVDLQVDGFFTDGAINSVLWTGVAPRWALGTNGTYTKTENTSAANWRDNYNGGMSTIPATANWILHRTPTSVGFPSLTTVNSWYPNLTIMNTAGGNWVTSVGSTFTGAASTATIKGNFDIGGPLGSAFGTVDFLNDNVFANPVLVSGNMTIRAGSSLRNYGTGFEISGNLTVDGSTSYDANDARKFRFSGGNAQTISGSGTLATFGVYLMEVAKSSNTLTLNRSVKVDNRLDLVNGIVNTTMANIMVIEDDAVVTNTSNASFIRGPVRKLGDEAFVFPTGKNSDYQPIAMGTGAAGGTTIFWTENFSTGAGWTLANVTGPEGADPNPFYIGAGEGGGIPPGGCGVANNGNNTLHVGSVFNPPGGAAYDAGGLCGILYCPQTNRRAQSPVINCTGRTNITLGFNYIEYGQGTTDNATLWYYDGATWTQIADPAKTPCCGGACNGFRQGQWTAFSILLPASANNNPNVRIGFKWENNDDGVGTDPSFAVDDVYLSVTSTVEQFTAEYFYSNPQVPYGNILDPTLNHISQCEYWILTRDAGSANRTVTLSWDANSCGVTNLADLRVARWRATGTIWNDLGNGGTTGTTAAGTIITSGPDFLFGPFTLASTTFENPLPVELLQFNAYYEVPVVKLFWSTASEKNNDYFSVERSIDGIHFYVITRVKGSGNSTSLINYAATDNNPLIGISYYRLKQFDFNGSFSLSKTIAIDIQKNTFSLGAVYAVHPQQAVYATINGYTGNVVCEILDMSGRLIYSYRKDVDDENNLIKIPVPSLSQGLYVLKTATSRQVEIRKFFY